MNPNTNRSINSAITACLFTVVQITTAIPASAETIPPPQEVQIPSIPSLNIPAGLGSVLSYQASPGPMLVHLQTAHGNYEAQKKIEAILHYLKGHYGFKTILLEGSAFKLEPEMLRFFPGDKKLTREVADDLAKEAWVKGAGLFLMDETAAEGYGIEDIAAYKANKEIFKGVHAAQGSARQFTEEMNIQIHRLGAANLGKDLKIFLKRLGQYEEGKIPFQPWLAYLKVQAKQGLGIDLENAAYQIDWPMLLRIFKLQRFEANLDEGAYPAERDKFLAALRPQFERGKFGIRPAEIYLKIQKLLNLPLGYHELSSPETARLFEGMIDALGPHFDYRAYPNVKYFIGHLILQGELKGELLTDEVNRLTGQITERLARTEGEKKIVTLLRQYALLQKLFALELTPADYEKILHADFLRPSDLSRRFLDLNKTKLVRDIKFSHRSEIDSLFDKALEFYRLAQRRDRFMIKNIERRLQETGADRAVIITGGFHAAPLREYFENHGFAYALISPKITEGIHPEERRRYVRSILQNAPNLLLTSTLESDYPEMRLEHRIEALGERGALHLAGFEMEKILAAVRENPEALRQFNQSIYSGITKGYGMRLENKKDGEGGFDIQLRPRAGGFLNRSDLIRLVNAPPLLSGPKGFGRDISFRTARSESSSVRSELRTFVSSEPSVPRAESSSVQSELSTFVSLKPAASSSFGTPSKSTGFLVFLNPVLLEGVPSLPSLPSRAESRLSVKAQESDAMPGGVVWQIRKGKRIIRHYVAGPKDLAVLFHYYGAEGALILPSGKVGIRLNQILDVVILELENELSLRKIDFFINRNGLASFHWRRDVEAIKLLLLQLTGGVDLEKTELAETRIEAQKIDIDYSFHPPGTMPEGWLIENEKENENEKEKEKEKGKHYVITLDDLAALLKFYGAQKIQSVNPSATKLSFTMDGDDEIRFVSLKNQRSIHDTLTLLLKHQPRSELRPVRPKPGAFVSLKPAASRAELPSVQSGLRTFVSLKPTASRAESRSVEVRDRLFLTLGVVGYDQDGVSIPNVISRLRLIGSGLEILAGHDSLQTKARTLLKNYESLSGKIIAMNSLLPSQIHSADIAQARNEYQYWANDLMQFMDKVKGELGILRAAGRGDDDIIRLQEWMDRNREDILALADFLSGQMEVSSLKIVDLGPWLASQDWSGMDERLSSQNIEIDYRQAGLPVTVNLPLFRLMIEQFFARVIRAVKKPSKNLYEPLDKIKIVIRRIESYDSLPRIQIFFSFPGSLSGTQESIFKRLGGAFVSKVMETLRGGISVNVKEDIIEFVLEVPLAEGTGLTGQFSSWVSLKGKLETGLKVLSDRIQDRTLSAQDRFRLAEAMAPLDEAIENQRQLADDTTPEKQRQLRLRENGNGQVTISSMINDIKALPAMRRIPGFETVADSIQILAQLNNADPAEAKRYYGKIAVLLGLRHVLIRWEDDKLGFYIHGENPVYAQKGTPGGREERLNEALKSLKGMNEKVLPKNVSWASLASAEGVQKLDEWLTDSLNQQTLEEFISLPRGQRPPLVYLTYHSDQQRNHLIKLIQEKLAGRKIETIWLEGNIEALDRTMKKLESQYTIPGKTAPAMPDFIFVSGFENIFSFRVPSQMQTRLLQNLTDEIEGLHRDFTLPLVFWIPLHQYRRVFNRFADFSAGEIPAFHFVPLLRQVQRSEFSSIRSELRTSASRQEIKVENEELARLKVAYRDLVLANIELMEATAELGHDREEALRRIAQIAGELENLRRDVLMKVAAASRWGNKEERQKILEMISRAILLIHEKKNYVAANGPVSAAARHTNQLYRQLLGEKKNRMQKIRRRFGAVQYQNGSGNAKPVTVSQGGYGLAKVGERKIPLIRVRGKFYETFREAFEAMDKTMNSEFDNYDAASMAIRNLVLVEGKLQSLKQEEKRKAGDNSKIQAVKQGILGILDREAGKIKTMWIVEKEITRRALLAARRQVELEKWGPALTMVTYAKGFYEIRFSEIGYMMDAIDYGRVRELRGTVRGRASDILFRLKSLKHEFTQNRKNNFTKYAYALLSVLSQTHEPDLETVAGLVRGALNAAEAPNRAISYLDQAVRIIHQARSIQSFMEKYRTELKALRTRQVMESAHDKAEAQRQAFRNAYEAFARQHQIASGSSWDIWWEIKFYYMAFVPYKIKERETKGRVINPLFKAFQTFTAILDLKDIETTLAHKALVSKKNTPQLYEQLRGLQKQGAKRLYEISDESKQAMVRALAEDFGVPYEKFLEAKNYLKDPKANEPAAGAERSELRDIISPAARILSVGFLEGLLTHHAMEDLIRRVRRGILPAGGLVTTLRSRLGIPGLYAGTLGIYPRAPLIGMDLIRNMVLSDGQAGQARKFFGIENTRQTIDAVMVGAGIALDYGALPVLDKIVGEKPFVVITTRPSDEAMIAQYNQEIRLKKGKRPIPTARSIQGAKQLLRRMIPDARPSIRAILGTSDLRLAEALKKTVADNFVILTANMFEGFVRATHLDDLVKGFKGEFLVSRSA